MFERARGEQRCFGRERLLRPCEIFGEFGFEAIDVDAVVFERFVRGDVFARVIGLLAAERSGCGPQGEIFEAIVCRENGGYEEAFAVRK